MADGHVLDVLASYALDSLDPQEREAVVAHLETCAACGAELQRYEVLVGQLGLAAPDAAPPPALRDRVLARARIEPARAGAAISEQLSTTGAGQQAWWGRLQPVLTVVSLVAVVALAVASLLLWQRVEQLASRPETVALAGTEAAPAARALLILEDADRAVLVVNDLPPLDAAQQYQLWLIDADGTRTSGGVFSVVDSGSGSLTVQAPRPLISYTALGVTIEPYGGSPGPTGDRVLGGSL